jgi:hypothetical protein
MKSFQVLGLCTKHLKSFQVLGLEITSSAWSVYRPRNHFKCLVMKSFQVLGLCTVCRKANVLMNTIDNHLHPAESCPVCYSHTIPTCQARSWRIADGYVAHANTLGKESEHNLWRFTFQISSTARSMEQTSIMHSHYIYREHSIRCF